MLRVAVVCGSTIGLAAVIGAVLLRIAAACRSTAVVGSALLRVIYLCSLSVILLCD